jgi:hypothetical protein
LPDLSYFSNLSGLKRTECEIAGVTVSIGFGLIRAFETEAGVCNGLGLDLSSARSRGSFRGATMEISEDVAAVEASLEVILFSTGCDFCVSDVAVLGAAGSLPAVEDIRSLCSREGDMPVVNCFCDVRAWYASMKALLSSIQAKFFV